MGALLSTIIAPALELVTQIPASPSPVSPLVLIVPALASMRRTPSVLPLT